MSMKINDWFDLTGTEPSNHTTPKDIYAVQIDDKPGRSCVSCTAGKNAEFKQCKTRDLVVGGVCGGCGKKKKSKKLVQGVLL